MIAATHAESAAESQFPSPQRERWQPLRGGLLNLYRYDAQEFRYEQGRLLLRGNNGTGKSRVLALQLPFLLDGEVAPHRLEPDRDPAKRIEWNLLMGRHRDRLGYTWIEFGRVEPDGTRAFLTLGCGLSAVEGRGLVGRWFFVTPRRVGHDLFLQSAAGHPLSRDRLEEVLDKDREVFRTAAAYRRAVDDALFRLGEHRYQALVNLLIQLRQPQLSRQLDEAQLSAALSEALPPVPDAVVADVAEAFRNLEAERGALEAYGAAGRAVETFLVEYRRYAQVAARRRAEVVRSTHAAYEATGRKLRAAESAHEEATLAGAELGKRLAELAAEEEAARATAMALAASPEMAGVRELERVRRAAGEHARAATLAAEDLERARSHRAEADARRNTAAEHAGASQAALSESAAHAQTAADGAALAPEHGRAVAHLRLPEGPDDTAPLDAARRCAEEAAAKRIQAARRLRELNEKIAQAQNALAAAKASQSELAAQLDTARDAEIGARDALTAAVDALVGAYRAWAAAVRELGVPETDETSDAIREWATAGRGESPVAVLARRAASAAEQRLATSRAEVVQQRDAVRRDLDELRAEQSRLASGGHRPPAVPATRSPGARDGRPGAPLWLLCDFRPDLDAATRAGFEAALESSGLLDAWVTPDGRLLAEGVHDTVLSVATSRPGEGEDHLGSVRVPSVDRDDPRAASVDDATVAALLRHIGARADAPRDGAEVWVDASGRWQLGPLHGSWAKATAEHVGQASRDAARRRRLAEIEAEIAVLAARIAALDAEIARIDERRRLARSEAESAPREDAVRSALASVEARSRAAEELRKRVSAAEERVLARRSDLTAATAKRDADAHDLGLAAWAEQPARLEEAVHAYRRCADRLWSAAREHLNARRVHGDAAAAAGRAAAEEDRCTVRHVDAQLLAAGAAAERDVLEESVGKTAQETVRRLEEARRRAEALREQIRLGDQERLDAAKRVGDIEGTIRTLGTALEGDSSRRADAIRSFAAFVATKLLGAAVAALAAVDASGWSDTGAVSVARRTEEALSSVESDDAAWERTQRGIHRHVQALQEALLPHGYSPVTTIADDVFLVEVPFQGRTCTMTELHDALADEIRERKVLLDAREREVLENYLVGEASLQLHDLLRRGEELVRHMNDELRQRPTSTGMMLRFAWNPLDDGPPGLAQARQQLLRAGATWSPAERQALGEFLQARIREMRAQRSEGTWQQHLAAALDYRTWHTFSVERCQDGHWKRLTRRTHGTGSGGEKAVALTVPQFAAAAAHYRTADPRAPRLILLDEAFVGIDADMRAKCMGLLAAFDLDFVMTSEREWGCYATVPGVAICQLATVPGVDAVGVTRWVWTGRERVRDTSAPPSVQAPRDPGPGQDLSLATASSDNGSPAA